MDRFHAKLSVDEGDSLHPSDFTLQQLEEYFHCLFQIADENGDGVLSPDEFRGLLECNGFRLDQPTIERLFAEADANHDGDYFSMMTFPRVPPTLLTVGHLGRPSAICRVRPSHGEAAPIYSSRRD